MVFASELLVILMSSPASLYKISPFEVLLSLAVIPVCEDTSLKALTASAKPAEVSVAGTLKVMLECVVLLPVTARA